MRRKQDGSGWRPDDTGTKRESVGVGTTKETRQENSSSFPLLFLPYIYSKTPDQPRRGPILVIVIVLVSVIINKSKSN